MKKKMKAAMKKKLAAAWLMAGCMALTPAAAFAAEDTAETEAAEAAAVEDTAETEAAEAAAAEDTAETEAAEDTAETEAAEDTAGAAVLSDNLYDFQVKIGDEVYQFPMTYGDFTARGWELGANEDPELRVGTNSYGTVYFNQGANSVGATVFNIGINEVGLEECLIGGITIDGSSEGYGVDLSTLQVELAGGIVMGQSNVDDIKAAYGDPTDLYDESEYYTDLTYELDYYEDVELYVYKDDNTLKKVEICNLVEPEGFDPGAVSTETPEIVASYTAPTALGEDLMDPVVEFCGDLYQLPAPVSAFVENGWTILDVAEGAYVAGDDMDFIDMTKNNQTVHFSIYNETENAVTIENCFVRELEVGTYDGEAVTLTLSGGITLGASRTDLIAMAEEKGYIYEDEDSYLNIYKTNDTSYDNYVHFWFNEDEDADSAATVGYKNSLMGD